MSKSSILSCVTKPMYWVMWLFPLSSTILWRTKSAKLYILFYFCSQYDTNNVHADSDTFCMWTKAKHLGPELIANYLFCFHSKDYMLAYMLTNIYAVIVSGINICVTIKNAMTLVLWFRYSPVLEKSMVLPWNPTPVLIFECFIGMTTYSVI